VAVDEAREGKLMGANQGEIGIEYRVFVQLFD